MRNSVLVAVAVWLAAAASVSHAQREQPAAAPAQVVPPSAPSASGTPVSPQRALLDQYCLGCHSDRVRAGGLALSGLNLDAVHQSAETAEKVIRKLRAGLMPPAG